MASKKVAGYAILGTVLLSLLITVSTVSAMVYTGRIETDLILTGEVTVSGAIPVGSLLLIIMIGIGGVVYVGLTFIGGTTEVQEATENYAELAEQASDSDNDDE